MMRPGLELHRATRGAAAVEFIIAFVPLFWVFFIFVQWSHLLAAKLVFRHATIAAARAAAVIHGPHNPGETGGQNGQDSDISTAGERALGPYWIGAFSTQSPPQFQADNAGQTGAHDTIVVRGSGQYACSSGITTAGSGIVAGIVCGGSSYSMHEQVTVARQGAEYVPE